MPHSEPPNCQHWILATHVLNVVKKNSYFVLWTNVTEFETWSCKRFAANETNLWGSGFSEFGCFDSGNACSGFGCKMKSFLSKSKGIFQNYVPLQPQISRLNTAQHCGRIWQSSALSCHGRMISGHPALKGQQFGAFWRLRRSAPIDLWAGLGMSCTVYHKPCYLSSRRTLFLSCSTSSRNGAFHRAQLDLGI